jgi:dihydrofolate reductase
MSKVIAGMTISLDGFVNDSSGSISMLYSDFESFIDSEPQRESIEKTGAVVMGRNAFAMATDPDWFADHYEYQVPIFVLTHQPSDKHPRESDKLTITFVTGGVESAIQQARSAAGEKDVTIIGGASVIRQCLQASLVDELHIDLMPILLGGGLRLFEDVGIAPLLLERSDLADLPAGRTHLKFRVLKQATDRLPDL